MNNSIHIPVVLGTARVGCKSEAVAKYVVATLEGRDDITTELVAAKDHVTSIATTPPWGVGGASETGSGWKDIIAKSGALVLVIPEYNHGYPGELKLLLDSLYEEYKGLSVAMVGVSPVL